MRKVFSTFGICLLTWVGLMPWLSVTYAADPKEDIMPLASSLEEGIGPLSFPHLRQNPIACVFVYGTEYPDLFITGSTGKNTSLYLCKWKGFSSQGAPIFYPPIKIPTNFGLNGTIIQTTDGEIHGLWIKGKQLLHTLFHKDLLTFTEENTITVPSKKNLQSLTVVPLNKGGYELVFELTGYSTPAKYTDQNPSSFSWRPFDEAGVNAQAKRYTYLCAAYLDNFDVEKTEEIRRLTDSEREVFMGMISLCSVQLKDQRGVLTGSRRGNFPFYTFTEKKNRLSLSARKYVANDSHILAMHPSIAPAVCSFTPKGSEYSHFIASGEGSVYFYRATDKQTDKGFPVYSGPVPVLQTQAWLDAGSLPSPVVADWDGDGVEDIIVGNSEGFILFYKNIGSNQQPRFIPETRVQAGGKDIHIQAGYAGSVQGTQESRWGYVSPTVVDWNGDGLLDLIIGDITGLYHIYINRGTQEKPQLDPAQALYCEGLPLHGTWRCAAAVGQFGAALALAVVDDEGLIHLYWRLDDYNVEDGGLLKLQDGSPILTHAEPAGGTGRCKLSFYDWDQDGKLDLIIGNGRRAAIPNLETGYPLPVLGKRTAGTPLFMKNVAKSNLDIPVFAHPQPFYHPAVGLVQPGGAHETGAVGTTLGGGKKPNLLVANEDGRLFLLKGSHMRLMDSQEAATYREKRNPFSLYNANP